MNLCYNWFKRCSKVLFFSFFKKHFKILCIKTPQSTYFLLKNPLNEPPCCIFLFMCVTTFVVVCYHSYHWHCLGHALHASVVISSYSWILVLLPQKLWKHNCPSWRNWHIMAVVSSKPFTNIKCTSKLCQEK